MAHILVVGGSDTGRAPLAAALLRRHLQTQTPQITVASAGILGHDGSPMQSQTMVAMEHLGLQHGDYTARSLTAPLVEVATLLLAVDRGIAKALLNHYPDAPAHALPDLAGSPRDVPDPFRMTLDAWIVYGRELDDQLAAALPEILQRCQNPSGSPVDQAELAQNPPATLDPLLNSADGTSAAQASSFDSTTIAAIDRLRILVKGIAGIPEVVDWQRARAAMRETLQAISNMAANGANPADLRPGAVAMLLGTLAENDQALTPYQLTLLEQAADLLAAPVDGAGLGELAMIVSRWERRTG